jgi:glycerol kinase
MRVAGIDQGTTSTKGLVLDEDGGTTLLPALPHRQDFPQPGFVEHDGEELLRNVAASIAAAARAGATAAGLANQGETVLAWDRDTGQPLGPAIVWQDQRTAAAVARMVEGGQAAVVRERAGLPLDCYFSASKLRWLLDNAPEATALARRGRLGLGTSDSYFIERLTGRYATDVTTAARTSLMNLGMSRWDETLCGLFGVPLELLPEIATDGAPLGEVQTEAGPVVLQSGAVDQIAALYGHGCRATGEGKVTVGTGAFALVISDLALADLSDGLVAAPGWRHGRARIHAVDGAVYTAAAAVDWLQRIRLVEGLAAIEALAGPSAAERGLFFVPALSGLAYPHWDRSATGLFIGIDGSTGREDMVKAVLEGVAFRIAEVLDAIGAKPGLPISADGGLMRSRYFASFLASVARRPLIDRSDIEVTALGMAALAMASARGTDPGAMPVPGQAAAAMIDPRPGFPADELRGRFALARDRSSGWRT